ncbi:MAG: flp pilus-assembly TadE/G-like family protein [Actinomycetaceae bacterium]|nr:flp pilus-assembly TadE/G-like family protein [Actinomycetaceae bacterium]
MCSGDEQGSGTVLALGVIGALAVLGMLLLLVFQVIAGGHIAQDSADLAALSGATQLEMTGDEARACADASRMVEENGARTQSCAVEGERVRVTTRVTVPLIHTFVAHALAGVAPE